MSVFGCQCEDLLLMCELVERLCLRLLVRQKKAFEGIILETLGNNEGHFSLFSDMLLTNRLVD